ncbi:hypothetical protein F4825DRAFT_452765 [Nemania diffusa]|nr:hypothetical protein F4825DRAFT_452765 [Nemania diffusa]
MAEPKACDKGDNFPVTQETSPDLSPPTEPEIEATPLTSKPLRSLTPRGQRFSKLSDAYLNITARQGSNITERKASGQSQSSTATSDLVDLAPFPVTSPRLVQSQDDLQISASALAMPSSAMKARRASFDSVDFFEGPSPKMGHKSNNYLGLSKEIESELLSLKAKSQDTTGSTIEGILAQYDAPTSSLEVEHDNTREYRTYHDLSLSRPPQGSLPDPPPTNFRTASSVRRTECDSPAPGSSITDSQHLLDVEAQAHELEEVRQALFPPPLNVGQSRRGTEILREPQHPVAPINTGTNILTENPFADQKVEDYKTYLRLPMERDISQQLSNASRSVGHNTRKLYSSDGHEDFPIRQGRPQENTLRPSSLLRVRAGDRLVRNIKVVIGRESETGNDNQSHQVAQVNSKNDYHDVRSEDGDWVTEATSDTGFNSFAGIVPRRSLIGGFKRAGSSIADYSDECNEDTGGRFGSRERIIQHPGDNRSNKSSDVQRLNESKFAALLPRRNNAFSENANRRWASAGQPEPGQFRPQVLHKSTNPYRELGCRRPETPRRLVFNFDQNSPPRYEFRDSISEYEPAEASTKANCGTQQYDTRGSLQSPVSDIGEDNHPSTTDARFDQSADLDADRNPSNKFSQHNQAFQVPRRSQEMDLSIYAAERQKQLEDFERQEFAAASSYYDPPSGNSVRSKFNFELLPLNLAQQKNKMQRDNGETNETESSVLRLKRKKGRPSVDTVNSPVERPARAFVTSRDLSINLSSNWQAHEMDLEDIPAPFAMGSFNDVTPSGNRRHRNDSRAKSLDTPSSPGTPLAPRSLWYGLRNRHLAQARNLRRYRPISRFIAPDDYVSDNADRTRRICFYILAALSFLPFFGILVLSGCFSEAFKWATQGEVDRLTFRQRRFIKKMLLVEAVFYTGGFVTIIVYFTLKNKTRN